MSRFRPLPRSFEYAVDGVKEAIKNEPNFRAHIFFAVCALTVAVILKISVTEWALVLMTICLVLILELVNTGVEAIVDLKSPDIHPKAKIAKDVLAAAVLLSAINAIFIGVLIFLPRIGEILRIF